ncbi:MAG: exosome complex protein Rrp42 [Candidatus Altiarchaeota archaeon]|nr:exosome complex protein Rrp42 [Candidatus Altiarchaeota archaeon]
MIDKVTLKLMNDSFKKGVRLDGRKLDEFRDITVETGVISKAEGSAMVSLGNSKVLVGVKVNAGEPYSDSPDSGVLMTGAELTAYSHDSFETGPPSPAAIEIARVVDRAIREAKIIDVSKLVIKSGEKVWLVFVDIYTINADGNIFDAATLGAMAALATAKLPIFKDGEIIRENLKDSLPVDGKVVSSTFVKVGESVLVDPTMQEESALDARLTIGIKDGNIVSLQKGGNHGFNDQEVEDMIDRSIVHSKKLLKALK